MTEDERTALRDEIARIVNQRLDQRWGLDTDFSRQIADDIMARLLGGAYNVTALGRDYLADHRRALLGGWDCAQDGHSMQLGDANGQNQEHYVNCAHCGHVTRRDAFRGGHAAPR